jgi:hypothetical protein
MPELSLSASVSSPRPRKAGPQLEFASTLVVAAPSWIQTVQEIFFLGELTCPLDRSHRHRPRKGVSARSPGIGSTTWIRT